MLRNTTKFSVISPWGGEAVSREVTAKAPQWLAFSPGSVPDASVC